MILDHKESISSREARNNFSDTINRVNYGGERIKIQKYGKDVAAVIPIEDLKFLEELEHKLDKKAIKEALREQGDEPFEDYEEVKKELNLGN